MVQISKKHYRVKVYLKDSERREEKGQTVRVTAWACMLAVDRKQIDTGRHGDGSEYPVYRYIGHDAEEAGASWPISTIDAFVSMSHATFTGQFKRHERYINGPLNSREADE